MAKIKKVLAPPVVATKPEPKPAVKEEKKSPSMYVGATTGLRVSAFMIQTLLENNKLKRTDRQILELWKKEFPMAKGRPFRDEVPENVKLMIVRAIRRGINLGRFYTQVVPPPEPIRQWDAKGQVVEERRRKAAVVAPGKAA